MTHRRTFRRLAALLAAATAALTVGVAAPGQAAAFTTMHGVRLNAVEARLATLINQARIARGIPPLTVAAGTTDLARHWSMRQATRNSLYHNPDLVSGVQRHGSSDWRAVAETVGRGWSADSLFTAYMNSPGHRANILDADLRYLGIGWVERPDGSGYNTQVFVDRYSTAYGTTRTPAVGGLADTRTPTSTASVASFEGWDARVHTTSSSSGLAVSRPVFPTPAAGDQSARFSVRETRVATGGMAELRVRDALDLRAARALRVKVSAVTATGRSLTVQIGVRRELGTYVTVGRVSVPGNGSFVTVTLPLPAGAKNFRNVLSVGVPRTSVQALSTVLSQRSAAVRVSDVAVVV